MRQTLIALLGSLMVSTTVIAATAQDAAAPPPMSAADQQDDSLEPDITIVPRRAGGSVEEYRLNGRLYAVRVKPTVGPSYYLVDADGDGYLERRMDALDEPLLIPGWVLFRW